MRALYPKFDESCLHKLKPDDYIPHIHRNTPGTTPYSLRVGLYTDAHPNTINLKSKLLELLLEVNNFDDINDCDISYTIFLVNNYHDRFHIHGLFKFIYECYDYYESIRKYERNKRMYTKRKEYIRYYGQPPPSTTPSVNKLNSNCDNIGSYLMKPYQFTYCQSSLTKHFFKDVSSDVSQDAFVSKYIYKYMNDVDFVYYDSNTHEFITDKQIYKLFRNSIERIGTKIYILE